MSMSGWPRSYTVQLACDCVIEVWRTTPYEGGLRCGWPNHEAGPAEWAAMPSCLIPVAAAPDSATAMHLLRELAEAEWGFDDAAQVGIRGPYPFERSESMGWWERCPSASGETSLFYIGHVAPR